MTACSAAPPAVQQLLQVVVAAGEEVGGAGGEGGVLEHGGGLHPQPGPAHRGLERLPVLQPRVNINIEVKTQQLLIRPKNYFFGQWLLLSTLTLGVQK